MSEIESEFKKTAKAINDKIKAAAMILEEANKLAKIAGIGGRMGYGVEYYDDDELEELTEEQEDLVDKISWSPILAELDAASGCSWFGWAVPTRKHRGLHTQ